MTRTAKRRVCILTLVASVLLWTILPRSSLPPTPPLHVDPGLSGQSVTATTADATETTSSVPPTHSPAASNAAEFKCRHRHSRYTADPKVTSPKLTALLQRYNRLHDRLLKHTPVLDSFKVPLFSRNNTVRYLHMRHDDKAPEDLPVQIYTLLSAYLLALLTDRVLVVDNDDYREVLCEPFNRSSWLVSGAALPANLTATADVGRVLSSRRPVRTLSLDLHDPQHRAALQCSGDLKEAFSHVQWLAINDTAGPFTHLLFANQAHDQRLWELFPDGAIVAPLYHHLIHPSNSIWRDLPELLKAYSDCTIERPLRVSFVGSVHHKDVHRVIYRASHESLAPDEADRTIALLVAPSDSKVLGDATGMFNPPRFLVAATAAHFYSDAVLDRYGRLFADLFLGLHSEVLLFDRHHMRGWLAHAIRRRNAIVYHQDGAMEDVPATDHPAMDELICEKDF